MPKYAKFLQDLQTNKRKLKKVNIVALNGDYSVILDKKLSKKLRDPGSFMIACLLGDGMEEHGLVDSGASINVMAYTIYLKLGMGGLRPTRMTLKLVNRLV